MIKGRWHRIPLSRGDWSSTDSAGLTVLPIKDPKKFNGKKHMVKTSLSLGCLFFFLLAVFAKDTWGGVAELEKSFLIQKCLSTQQAKPTLCVRDSGCHKNAIASWPPNKDRHFKLTKPLLKHTPTDSAVMLGGLSFLPCRSLKVHAFTVYLRLFSFLSLFWWRKRSQRWKAYLMFIVVLSWTAFRVQRQY